MARKGRKFELSYQWLYSLDKNKYTVTSPAFLYDRASQGDREVDVLVEYLDNEGIKRKIGIECRDRKSVVDVTGIEQLKQKKEDMGLDFLVVTTTKRFTEGAINKAAKFSMYIDCEMNAYPCSFDNQMGRYRVSLRNMNIIDAWNSMDFLKISKLFLNLRNNLWKMMVKELFPKLRNNLKWHQIKYL